MNAIIGTGGHIDHGKTALVAALTGADTDRLPEEKRRGISIDLGFTRLDLDGRTLGIVDVPGHEDFIRNMLAGATGFDLLLLVVAADEGVMPQTREHVAIAELLEVPAAVVALTKTDLVGDEWLELARDDVAGFLAETAFADAPIIPTSATTGEGLDQLRTALADHLTTERDHDDLFRMPADRVFTVRGTGTVVTGTVWSGVLETGATVRIEPGDRTARVRGLQVHGADVPCVMAGQRAAVALAGVDRGDLRRGVCLHTHQGWQAASILTVRLGVVRGSDWSIEQRQRVRVHLGTAEALARVRLLDAERLLPGEEAWAQLRLESPLLARAHDRFVLRSYSPVTTIGGGRVAEPDAPRRKRSDNALFQRLAACIGDDPDAALKAVVGAAGRRGAPTQRLPLDAGVKPSGVERWLKREESHVAGERAFTPGALEEVAGELHAAVRAHQRAHPLRPGIELEELRRAGKGAAPELIEDALDRLVRDGLLEPGDGRIAEAGFEPALDRAQQEAARTLVSAIAAAGAAPPGMDELAGLVGDENQLHELLGFLEYQGEIVRLQPGLYLHRPVLERLATDVTRALGGRSGLGPADFREVIEVSRKHLIPILEHLDVRGVTVRQGEGRAVPAG